MVSNALLAGIFFQLILALKAERFWQTAKSPISTWVLMSVVNLHAESLS